MNKQEYVEYLNEELKIAREMAEKVTSALDDDFFIKAPFGTVISIIQSGLNYLSEKNLEEQEGIFSNFKEQLNVIEAFSLENELEVIKNTYWKEESKSIYGFYAYSIQIIRAILAMQYTEMGVKVECQLYESDDPLYVFDLSKASNDDIKKSAFNYIGFVCPLTNAKYDFFSFEDRNEAELLANVKTIGG